MIITVRKITIQDYEKNYPHHLIYLLHHQSYQLIIFQTIKQPRTTLQQQISKNNSVKSPSISSSISQDDTPAHLNKEEDIKNKETTTTRC